MGLNQIKELFFRIWKALPQTPNFGLRPRCICFSKFETPNGSHWIVGGSLAHFRNHPYRRARKKNGHLKVRNQVLFTCFITSINRTSLKVARRSLLHQGLALKAGAIFARGSPRPSYPSIRAEVAPLISLSCGCRQPHPRNRL